ncbi:hypothetical protein V497_01704 [Pseudogymnoascus sp. VKM F-4516 (FW-969)]|nr:hypothetical protein V497_01704 [Pseudogymnoascus sp. VKM F-4516 (FW-969)]
MSDPVSDAFMDAKIFEDLQSCIDADAEVREQIKTILQKLERQGRSAHSILSRAHSTPTAQLQPVIEAAEAAIRSEVESVGQLSEVASKFPYYKYNAMWTKDVQNVIFAILLCGWLGGMATKSKPAEAGRLLTIEEVGDVLNVPVNLKVEDSFHITIEEYLHSLISLIEELARLATNSVTLGDFARPLAISKFVKDLFAGFQLLNLKNDSLRRRSDSIKYQVKKIEDVKRLKCEMWRGNDLISNDDAKPMAGPTPARKSRASLQIRNNVVPDNPPRNDESPPGTTSIRHSSQSCPARQSPSAMPSPAPPTTIAKPASPAAPASPSAAPTTSTSPPPTTAIYKVNTTLSSVYTHVHTPLLFSSVFFSLPALVANPLSTLTYGAGALALVQSAYCAICLQPALGGTATKKKKKKTKAKVGPPGAQVKKEEEVDMVGPAIDIAYRLAIALVLTILSTVPVFIATILLGAPLTTHLPHTTLLTLHIAFLALFPLFYARPLSSRHWLEIISLTAPLDEVFGAAAGTLAGAWIGAIPIPLDWDRPWQAWPITVAVGAYVGWGIGRQAGVLTGVWPHKSLDTLTIAWYAVLYNRKWGYGRISDLALERAQQQCPERAL